MTNLIRDHAGSLSATALFVIGALADVIVAILVVGGVIVVITLLLIRSTDDADRRGDLVRVVRAILRWREDDDRSQIT